MNEVNNNKISGLKLSLYIIGGIIIISIVITLLLSNTDIKKGNNIENNDLSYAEELIDKYMVGFYTLDYINPFRELTSGGKAVITYMHFDDDKKINKNCEDIEYFKNKEKVYKYGIEGYENLYENLILKCEDEIIKYEDLNQVYESLFVGKLQKSSFKYNTYIYLYDELENQFIKMSYPGGGGGAGYIPIYEVVSENLVDDVLSVKVDYIEYSDQHLSENLTEEFKNNYIKENKEKVKTYIFEFIKNNGVFVLKNVMDSETADNNLIFRNDFNLVETNEELWINRISIYQGSIYGGSYSMIESVYSGLNQINYDLYFMKDKNNKLIIENLTLNTKYTVSKINNVELMLTVSCGQSPMEDLYLVLTSNGSVYASRVYGENFMAIYNPEDFENSFFKIEIEEKVIEIGRGTLCVGSRDEYDENSLMCDSGTAVLKTESGKEYALY